MSTYSKAMIELGYDGEFRSLVPAPLPSRFYTKQDAVQQHIIPSLGNYANDHDVDVIFDQGFSYHTDIDSSGVQHGNGWWESVNVERYWKVVEAARRDAG